MEIKLKETYCANKNSFSTYLRVLFNGDLFEINSFPFSEDIKSAIFCLILEENINMLQVVHIFVEQVEDENGPGYFIINVGNEEPMMLTRESKLPRNLLSLNEPLDQHRVSSN